MDKGALLRVLLEKDPPKTKGGDVDWLFRSAREDVALLERVAPLGRQDLVLDLGCGYGRLALATYYKCRYVGVDVSDKRLAYARRLFAPLETPDVEFYLVPVYNPKYNRGGQPPAEFALWLPDNSVQAAAAISLFTHMPERDGIGRYLREIDRVLQPGGALLSTWLTTPPFVRAEASDHRRAAYSMAEIEASFKEIGHELVYAEGDGAELSHLRLLTRKATPDDRARPAGDGGPPGREGDPGRAGGEHPEDGQGGLRPDGPPPAGGGD